MTKNKDADSGTAGRQEQSGGFPEKPIVSVDRGSDERQAETSDHAKQHVKLELPTVTIELIAIE